MANYVTRSIFTFSLLLFIAVVSCVDFSDTTAIPEVKIQEVHETKIEFPAPIPVMIAPCPQDMVYIEKYHYCIDQYEAPNQKGAYPFYAQTAYRAVEYCHSQDKELCNQDRWVIACRGPRLKLYPYGNSYRRGVCNDDKYGWVKVPWETMGTPAWDKFAKERFKGEPSGFRPACVSGYGVYDMTGNVAEWTIEPRNHWGYVTKGGYWYGVLGKGYTPSCDFVNPAHAAWFSSYEFGFRCCKEAK
jgi:sulfatase modifying factor 1